MLLGTLLVFHMCNNQSDSINKMWDTKKVINEPLDLTWSMIAHGVSIIVMVL